MFNAARLKLTVFYLAVILVFSLALSIGIRALAQHEFNLSNDAQRGEVHYLTKQFYGAPTLVFPAPDNDFAQVQQKQEALFEHHLNQYLILLNLAALAVGGALSFWYAGRTLKPIIEAHDAQKRFASDASHELRTPLANMKLENEVFLRQKKFTEPEARDLIVSNLEEVQRLENLSKNLLALTQYEETSIPLKTLNIQTIVNKVLQQSKKQLAVHDAKTEQDLAAARIIGDEASLVELLNIVLDNALKYGPKGETITLQGHKVAGQYNLSVRDQGPGIDIKDLPNIFDRLYRGDKARSSSTAGYGLGLSLAQKIAEANHATLQAKNHPKGGAIFTLVLGLAG